MLRRWTPSLALFAAVQAVASVWILASQPPAGAGRAVLATLLGPFNLLLRLDRLWHYGQWPRDAFVLALLGAIAWLPWAHAWRPRRTLLALSLLGSVLWAAAGFLFTIDHL
jgi:hypothetical protein